ncbi:hypothetical protein [Methanoregula sp.]|uniref:hypothetical protein n=1 Tax=Methanoregula sp. TaxID=2052170 RepID=UPI003C70A6A5
MKLLWIAVLLCAGAVLVLAVALPGGAFHDQNNTSMAGDSSLNGSREINLNNLLPPQIQERGGNSTNLFGTVSGNKTALFSKYVSADTRYIIVSLYSGDISDPISVTIITPDSTLGPFYDGSDGVIDGRIDLKISNPDGMTPGVWKFLVHSNKNISYGSLENLSWIRTGTD